MKAFKSILDYIVKKKRIVITLFAFFVLLIIAALIYRKKINDVTSISSYRVECDIECNNKADRLKELCRDMYGVRLFGATGRSHLYLHLANTGSKAELLGFSLNGYGETGYMITRYGNGLYLLSASDEGLERAIWYLANRLVDKDGKLLIAQDQRISDFGTNVFDGMEIYGTDISEYSIVADSKEAKEIRYEIGYYFTQALGFSPEFKEKSDSSYIELKIDTATEKDILMEPGRVVITARDKESLSEEAAVFANTYLGWMEAGTLTEKCVASTDRIVVGNEVLDSSEPWMEKREPIITLWNTNYSRGVLYNESTSLKTNLMTMSDEQLYQYVKMLKFCGFTGIQFTDMCSAWAGAGSYEFVHDRLRTLAEAAKSLDMDVTLWVWGSEFTGYGWVDDSVIYHEDGKEFAYESQAVIDTFNKYYDIYAELADIADRVIAHFIDPGNLQDAEDVAYFAKMLMDKMHEKNPQIDFGVSCWIDAYDKQKLVETLGNNITIYEGTQEKDLSKYESFRAFCRNNGCRLGTWAWDTCEMEIDQLAQVNFNPHFIQSVYQNARAYDSVMKPGYWSEMDSNHVMNVFSLYCAGHMLINPDLNPDELSYEVALNFTGEKYADSFLEVLKLIEDARTGYTWDTFWWSSPEYILKSDKYPAKDIALRSEKALAVLEKMISEGDAECLVPMPLDINDVLRLLVPQIRQIQSFAEFRISFEKAKDMVKNGAEAEVISSYLAEIATPISEYNTVTGLWGQIETRAQQEMLYDFCSENNLRMPVTPYFRRMQKNRIYGSFVLYQKGHEEPVYQEAPYFQGGFAYGYNTEIELVNEMIEEGLLSVDKATGKVYLTDWEHYQYAFN